MSTPPKDDENTLLNLSKNELSMLVVAFTIGIFLVTVSASIIIAMFNPENKLNIIGEWDLDRFQDMFFILLGSAIAFLGIGVGSKTALLKK